MTKLREGDELVMGNRFKGGIAPGAMPGLHKYLGNPVLTGIGRLFFKPRSAISIAGCAASIAERLRRSTSSPRDGVRERDGRQGDVAAEGNRRGADNAVARWPLSPAASAQLARRLAPPQVLAAVLPEVAVLLPRRRSARPPALLRCSGSCRNRAHCSASSSTSTRSHLALRRWSAASRRSFSRCSRGPSQPIYASCRAIRSSNGCADPGRSSAGCSSAASCSSSDC